MSEASSTVGSSRYPNLAATPTGGTDAWSWLTARTDVDGNVGTTAGTHVYGPYMQKAPGNQFLSGAAQTAVNVVTGAGTAVTGTPGTHAWAYNSDTGEIKAVLPTTVSATELGLDENNDIITASE